jgi:hypothetical protein
MQTSTSLYQLLTHGQLLVRRYTHRSAIRAVTSLILSVLVAATTLTSPATAPAHASGRTVSYLTDDVRGAINAVEGQGNTVKHLTLSKASDDAWVILYGRKGYRSHGVPSELSAKLHDINNRDLEINLVELGPNDSWVVIYGDDGYAFSGGIPEGLKDAIKDARSESGIIEYVMMDAKGHYVMRSSKATYYSLPTLAHEQVKTINRAGHQITSVMYGQVQCFEGCPGVVGYVIVFDGNKVWKEPGCCIGSGNLNDILRQIESGDLQVRLATSGYDNAWAIFGD